MTHKDEQEHILLVLKGDANAFRVLVDQYKDMVFTLCLKMVKNREEAEEMAQDSFVKIYRSIHQFKGDSKFSTWVYKITYHTCLDHLRKLRRTEILITLENFSDEQIASLQFNFEQIQAKERKELVQECLQLLTEEDSFILTLYYLEEQSIKEMAIILGITETNTKVRIYRCRNKLTAILQVKNNTEKSQYYETA